MPAIMIAYSQIYSIPVSRKNGDPIKMGTPVPIIAAENGDPLIKMGTPYHTRGWCKFELRLRRFAGYSDQGWNKIDKAEVFSTAILNSYS